jgi:hypothetical protein
MTLDEDGDEPVGPSQCALAVAVPLTMGDLLADLDPAAGKDFARSLSPGTGPTSPLACWRAFAPAADFVRERMEAAAALGAKVVPRARLADLASLLQTHRVVTLLTHTRLFSPVGEDAIRDAGALWRRLRLPSTMILENLRDRLLGPAPAGADPQLWAQAAPLLEGAPADGETALRTLVAALNALLRETEATFAHTQLRLSRGIDPIHLHPWTRPLLEAELSGDLVPSGSVELADGMKSVAELAATVSPGYDGVIDLSACNSLFLVGDLKRAAPGCTVIWNRMLARLAPCAARYVFILGELARERAPYVATFGRVTTALQRR